MSPLGKAGQRVNGTLCPIVATSCMLKDVGGWGGEQRLRETLT